ncbi:hypothetical protein HYU14_04385 [Candidatus Woesearchaeota archaeon]|nr:hypothetical protein [Candidatus Woesearchaeota archaeon]
MIPKDFSAGRGGKVYIIPGSSVDGIEGMFPQSGTPVAKRTDKGIRGIPADSQQKNRLLYLTPDCYLIPVSEGDSHPPVSTPVNVRAYHEEIPYRGTGPNSGEILPIGKDPDAANYQGRPSPASEIPEPGNNSEEHSQEWIFPDGGASSVRLVIPSSINHIDDAF